MAFNQNRAGAPNSVTGRAAEAVANRTGPNSAIGRTAENVAVNQEMKHGVRGTGLTGTGTGYAERGVGVLDEQLDRERLQGVTGIRTETTGQSDAFCPNPNTPGLPKEFETRVQVIEKVPEMKTVTKTDYVKRLDERTETVLVPKTKVVMEEVERVDMVPHVKEIEKTRTETRHRVVEEQVQVPYTEKVVVNVPVPRRETVPRVVTEQVETTVTVPIVKEVPVQRQVQVPTGNYCETPINEFQHAGKGLPTGLHGEKIHADHKILNKEVAPNVSAVTGTGVGTGVGTGLTGTRHTGTGLGHTGVGHTGVGTAVGTGLATGTAASAVGAHRTGLTSSTLDDDRTTTRTGLTGTGTHTGTGFAGTTGTHSGTDLTTGTTTEAPKKKSLLQKIEDKLMPGHHH